MQEPKGKRQGGGVKRRGSKGERNVKDSSYLTLEVKHPKVCRDPKKLQPKPMRVSNRILCSAERSRFSRSDLQLLGEGPPTLAG